MNGTQTATRQAKPPPTGPAPPPPTTTTPNTANTTTNHAPKTNGVHGTAPAAQQPPPKGKKKNPEPAPVDPSQMYETLKNKIAALEEDAVHEEEEERKFTEEAQDTVSGLSETAIHSKYIELFAELKRVERDHAKEKQKLTKDKDAAKGQLTKANQTKTKMENLARELQKDNKRLREDSKRLASCVEEAQEEISQMKTDMARRAERVKIQDSKYREMPDIVVKVNCKYRAELFFKISRKTKLSRLFNAWTERMESGAAPLKKGGSGGTGANGGGGEGKAASVNGTSGPEKASAPGSMQFVFTHAGRVMDAQMTPEEAGMEDGDEILAVEMMDLTEGAGTEELDEGPEPVRQKLKKNWTDNPREARRTVEEIFENVVRERLKEVFRQYELRERHFECVIRSKELEVLLSRARAAEQKQLVEGEKGRADKLEEENTSLRKELEEAQNGQTMLIDKLIACCKEILLTNIRSGEFFKPLSEVKNSLAWEDPCSNRGYVRRDRERTTRSADANETIQLRAKAPDQKESMDTERDWD
ncbi:hypothetical protein EIP91_012124 [Steccherinum ochraceum]|uniref:Ubiquitin-like domain-containing protein n=1 Tax=Steccherinum ochraceum TaxID=92696 RepID=A0A4R0RWE7_9APHY|nr:hypothetical protein EIP91_012124 [Steccherinum ochraceum]